MAVLVSLNPEILASILINIKKKKKKTACVLHSPNVLCFGSDKVY